MSSSEFYIKHLVKGQTTFLDGIMASQRGENWVSGDVNIADLIFTKDMTVNILGDGVFQITADDPKFTSPNQAVIFRMFKPASKVDAVIATERARGNETNSVLR